MTIHPTFITPPRQIHPLKADAAKGWFDDFVKCAEEKGECPTIGELDKAPQLKAFLSAMICLSRYLRELAIANPAMVEEILTRDPEELLDEIITRTKTHGREMERQADLMAALRKEKKRIAFLCAMLDLGGWWNGERVTKALADFADAALYAALDFALLAIHNQGRIELATPDEPQRDCGVIILAMGKHGAKELNYSSDIDIIIFFEEAPGLALKTDDPVTLFTRMAQQIVKIMQERTADGYVFRTDLRLRPDPASTPPAIPVSTALHYYEAHGQNWERAAMIKARSAVGDILAGENFLKELSPFVWRKYLDYAAIQEVHSVKRQIHAHKGHGTIAVHGHNVKLGRGGIREIEFFVQTQQLIAGGRIPELRQLRTIDALNALCELEWISADARDELSEAYWYLRDVEHRLQMVGDEQTQTLPEEDGELLRIARMMGDEDTESFGRHLVARMETVERHYAALFERTGVDSGITENLAFAGEDDNPETLETLATMGFQRPQDISRAIRGWHYGRFAAFQSARARTMLVDLAPRLLLEISRSDKPDEIFFALDRFIAGLPAGIQLFSLLNSNPAISKLLILILGSAPRLAEIITRKPHVFDGLLDPAFSHGVPDFDMLRERYVQELSRAPSYEAQLDMARIYAAEQQFLIGVRLLDGIIDPAQAGRAYSDLADVLIDGMLNSVRMEFEQRHGAIKGGRIAIIGMGKLGSHELTAGSDLDLILLYDHDEDADYSDGPKQLDVTQYFIRLTQRLITAMSAPTAEGVMYELDFRLRPSGNAGPVATPFKSFSKYQREEAWTWESQALTRARCVAGDTSLCREVEADIAAILSTPRDEVKLAEEISAMRGRIEQEKASENPWNIKSSKGGLIDIEFLGQWSILRMSPHTGERKTAIADMLELGKDSLYAAGDLEKLQEALRNYSAIIQISRLCLESDFDPETAPRDLVQTICDQMNQPDASVATAWLRETQLEIREIFERLIGPVNAQGS